MFSWCYSLARGGCGVGLFDLGDDHLEMAKQRGSFAILCGVPENAAVGGVSSCSCRGAFDDALLRFLVLHPEMNEAAQRTIDRMRHVGGEFERLDAEGHVYLDYTGGSQHGRSQLDLHMKLLSSSCFGNPHSVNPTSAHSTVLVEKARHAVLEHFHADPEEYMCVFTHNASAALRVVGESYPFCEGSEFALLQDNHNSVNGIREFARNQGATVKYIPVNKRLGMDVHETSNSLRGEEMGGTPTGSRTPRKLFAYPAQSNFSGAKHSLDMVRVAQAEGWDVLLDAAAFVPTNELDLRSVKPEFVCLSFYKMFGYPTGIGALIMKKSMVPHLRRPWFAGGTVEVVSVNATRYWPAQEHEAFEDGTVSYMGIPAVAIGLDFINSQLGGIQVVNTRVAAFTEFLLAEMTTMVHDGGAPLVRLYGPTTASANTRGGTIAFNVLDKDGVVVSDLIVEKLAMAESISIRAGCFCNPGASEAVFGAYVPDDTATLPDDLTKTMVRRMVSTSIGAVRVSVGYSTNFADVFKFTQFIRSTFTNVTASTLDTTAAGSSCVTNSGCCSSAAR